MASPILAAGRKRAGGTRTALEKNMLQPREAAPGLSALEMTAEQRPQMRSRVANSCRHSSWKCKGKKKRK